MPPKGRKATKRRLPKRGKEAETQPELDDILAEFYDVPPIEEFVGASIQRALEQIKQIGEHREHLKEQLKLCWTKKKV